MTNYELSVLVHYFGWCSDHPDIVENPPIWRPTIDRLRREGLLTTTGPEVSLRGTVYELTERGRLHVENVLAVPFPDRRSPLRRNRRVVVVPGHDEVSEAQAAIEKANDALRVFREKIDLLDPKKVLQSTP